ncbi:hypothetical protein [Methyloceanibacter caenitepidi]|uniref:Holin n=1 Tax=Methyloceanibacter caenitepidi TaxID=1384459 RepID=A0A0A8K7K5_9HYPH|nr:hypothetical protein [Methyloceanibacter caenitepidi]BAQ17984.1 hypothetical protein GL4_2550 [Methyloceanibacter caenitepidi]
MTTFAWLLTGGFAKGYRTQILGITAALSAVGLWAVGDLTLAQLLSEIPVILGGLGLAALGAKVDDATAKSAPHPDDRETRGPA